MNAVLIPKGSGLSGAKARFLAMLFYGFEMCDSIIVTIPFQARFAAVSSSVDRYSETYVHDARGHDFELPLGSVRARAEVSSCRLRRVTTIPEKLDLLLRIIIFFLHAISIHLQSLAYSRQIQYLLQA